MGLATQAWVEKGYVLALVLQQHCCPGACHKHTFCLPCTLPMQYPNVLTLRVRMPIVADLVYPRNFITKIIK